MKYSIYQKVPAELVDDAPILEHVMRRMTQTIIEQVTAGGFNVTSDVTYAPPQFTAIYEDGVDDYGEPMYREASLESRDANPRLFPCPRCNARYRQPCVTVSGRRASRYHRARYPAVWAGYRAWAETDKVA